MTINYYIATAICLAIAIIVAIFIPNKPLYFKDSHRELRFIVLLSVLFIVVYSILSCLRYYQMYYGLWDLGTFDAIVMEALKFKGFLIGYEGVYMEHFSPMILFWAPFYRIWDSPYVLLIGQSVLLGIAGIPLFFFCKKTLKSSEWSAIIVVMYFLNPYLSRFTLYEYHMGCFYPILFFSAWLALAYRRHLVFMILLFASVLAKESFCLVIIAVGIYLCTRKKYRLLGICCLGGIGICIFFILKIWFPFIVPLNYHHTASRFPPLLGGTLQEIIQNIGHITLMIFSWDSMAVLISLAIPFAFLPLISWRIFTLLVLPVFLVQICSSHTHQRLLLSHYSDIFIPLLPIASALALSHLRELRRCSPARKHYFICFSITLTLTAHVMFCEMPYVKYNSYIPNYIFNKQLGFLSIPFRFSKLQNPRAEVFHQIKDSIPPDLTVCSQNNLAPFFLRHKRIYNIRNPQEPDVYVFDFKTFDGYDPLEVFENLISKVSNDPKYVCVFNDDGFLVFYARDLIQKAIKSFPDREYR